MSPTARFMLLALALFASPALGQGQAFGQGQVGGQRGGWVARTTPWERDHVVRLLRESYLEDEVAKGIPASDAVLLLEVDEELATRLVEDLAARDEDEADLPAQRRRDLRGEERAGRLEQLSYEVAALVDLTADPDGLPSALRPLAFEALALRGPEEEAALLLPVLRAAGVETPYEVFMRLGALGGTVPEIEEPLVELALREPDASACFQALARCGGERTLERLRLVERVSRGELAAALPAFNLLTELAARDGAAVATAIVAQLEARLPQGGCDETRRHMLHRLLGRAAHPEGARYLLDWSQEALREGVEGAPPEVLVLALQALGAIGSETTVQALRELEERFANTPLHLTVLEALGHVPLAAAREQGLLDDLVRRMSLAERSGEEPAVRLAIHRSLGRITSAAVSPSSTAWRVFIRQANQAAARSDEAR